MNKRDSNRDAKRHLIVETARQLMQARASADFSMRVLADVAGVSTATPYSLFGSKQAVVAAVMDTDFDDFLALLPVDDKPGFTIFFQLIEVSVSMFGQNPGYYQTGALAIQGTSDRTLTLRFGLPRHALLRDLISRRIQRGEISHQVDADALALTLGHQFQGWIQSWAKGDIELPELVLHAQFSMGLGLAAVATEEARTGLFENVLALQAQLPSTGSISALKRPVDHPSATPLEARQ